MSVFTQLLLLILPPKPLAEFSLSVSAERTTTPVSSVPIHVTLWNDQKIPGQHGDAGPEPRQVLTIPTLIDQFDSRALCLSRDSLRSGLQILTGPKISFRTSQMVLEWILTQSSSKTTLSSLNSPVPDPVEFLRSTLSLMLLPQFLFTITANLVTLTGSVLLINKRLCYSPSPTGSCS